MLCDSVHAQCLEDLVFLTLNLLQQPKVSGFKMDAFSNQNNFQSYLTIINTDKLK